MLKLREMADLIKDLKYIFMTLGLSGFITISNFEKAIEYAEKFNFHIVLFVLSLTYILHRKQEKNIKSLNNKLENHMVKSAQDNLKSAVKQLAKDLKDTEIIDFEHTIKYIYDLEERRQELKLNSYTEQTLKELISRIKQ